MLKKMNDDRLRRSKVDDKYIFFIQRWRELCYIYTIDSYKFKVKNVCNIYDELLSIVKIIIDGTLNISLHNFSDVKDEAISIFKSDKILEKYDLAIKHSILRILNKKVTSKSKEDGGSDKFYCGMRLLYSELCSYKDNLNECYFESVLEELKLAIDEGNLENQNIFINILVSLCVHNGWTELALSKICKEIFYKHIDANEKWTNFVNKLKASCDGYTVFYKIKTNGNIVNLKDALGLLGINCCKGNEIYDQFSNSLKLKSLLNADNYYGIINVNAHDFNAAALKGVQSLNKKLSVASYYNYASKTIISDAEIIVFNGNSGVTIDSKQLINPSEYLDASTNNVFNQTVEIFNSSQYSLLANKLMPVFSYVSLSRASMFQETKYINLWIALESIMNTGNYTDIITHIKGVLPAVLNAKYIYRLFRNFAEDCIRCEVNLDSLAINLQEIDKHKLVADIIAVMRDEIKSEVLQCACAQNQLLTFRFLELKELIADKNNIVKRLREHEKRLEWHIQRLYRIRNEIAHSAIGESVSLVIYIEHLYSYLTQLITEIVYIAKHKNTSDIGVILATLVEGYKTYMEILSIDGDMSVQDILPFGIINIYR
ncbi:MAG: hypothetical protein R3Y45_04735 [Bacillota bacterium]